MKLFANPKKIIFPLVFLFLTCITMSHSALALTTLEEEIKGTAELPVPEFTKSAINGAVDRKMIDEKTWYKDPAQSIVKRVEDLLSQMTLEEKVAQLGATMPMALLGASGLNRNRMKAVLGEGLGHISGITTFVNKTPEKLAEFVNDIQRFMIEHTRLGIPAIINNESLNGFMASEATNFPTPIGLAATWEPELVEQMADLIRRQMRAVGVHQALSPVLDVARDARWGRVYETYGEDPYLCASMSTAYVKGLQGRDFKEGAIATGKHFLGYGLSEAGQNMAATHIGKRELYETFARPFEAAIRDAGMGSIMNSFSEIDGIPVGSSKDVLTGLLRKRMGFEGFVVSDYRTIPMFVYRLGTATNLQQAGVQALKAGLDVELPNVAGYGSHLVKAVQQGLISENLVNQSVRRVLEAKFKLGLFENPYVDLKKIHDVYADPQNRKLSRLMANKSITLLKNNDGLLPLKKDIGMIAVIGPHADTVNPYFPGYTIPSGVELIRGMFVNPTGENPLLEGDVLEDAEAVRGIMAEIQEILAAESMDAFIKKHYPAESVLEAVTQVVSESTKILYAPGCDLKGKDVAGIQKAVEIARQADVAIVALGGKCGWALGSTEGEGHDTANLDLPGVQEQLLQAVLETETPVVLVLFSGRPYTISWAAEHVPAILGAYYPGQEGGAAIAGALFGDINPGGKLPITIPRHVGQVPIFHYHKQGSGYRRTEADTHKGYTDMPSTPLYPFGHGLSYTTFEYKNLRLSPSHVDSHGAIDISCDVTNVGEVAGDDVVQLYLHDREATVTRPIQELAGFKRVRIEPGTTRTVTFTVQMSQLSFYNRDMALVVEPGNVDVMIGASSADIRLNGEFEITGDVVHIMGRRSFASQVTVSGK